ncbi:MULTISPECIES: magnesium and cobalt transport protein CorA [unclassified Microbacterium]|uniref:magnesium and cobalt transport protein CorA n=1 Tax=unclassified Microbacterium TaxID=2609290 RepID=UPI000CFD224F|nr:MULTISPECIES: magnesium and cobalt transport protein CorA [unclassified Microbacterium]PQZ61378.1 magnesium transporter [Microbacterium sp. MYb43]PQZ82589.1 magnesium transporter [Microbacterium sp. MYb40]PRB23711.1 magnesium transporter [Microbacterium sp. MYb54]PRB29606.1 magnesium transporter [Microbacterium sp. MYb50]PRB71036.1 magnesium transporter [Microbacterium sp. MYb24]
MVSPSRDDSTQRRNSVFRRQRPAENTTTTATTRRTRYVDAGHLVRAPRDTTVGDAQTFTEGDAERTALLLYPHPTPADIAELAESWHLHPLLVEDLLHAGQRPKLERYEDTLFLVVRSAWYVDSAEDVDFAEFHILVRPQAVAIFCQDRRWIDGLDADDASGAADRGDHTLLDDERLLEHGPEAVLYRLLDAIVDGYAPVLRGLEVDKEQIERQVFSGDATVTERIYRLSQEVIDLRQATSGLTEVLHALRKGFDRYGIPEALQTYLQDVADHLSRVDTQVAELRESLSQILTVNGTLVAQRQNEDMKKISGWAAILFAPTLIGAIYGMNFDNMPELHWTFGYPLAIGGMIAFALVLFLIFKRQKWM